MVCYVQALLAIESDGDNANVSEVVGNAAGLTQSQKAPDLSTPQCPAQQCLDPVVLNVLITTKRSVHQR